MAAIKFTKSELQAKRDTIQRAIDDLAEQTSNLEHLTAEMFTSWEGDAAEFYKERFDQSSCAMGTCLTYMKEYVKALDTVIASYAAVEAVNKLAVKF